MGNMYISHDPVVIADAGHAGILRGTEVESAKFPNCVAVADFKPCRLASIFLVLRRSADGRKLEKTVVAANRRVALDHDVRAYRGARTDFHIRPNYGISADFDRAVDF